MDEPVCSQMPWCCFSRASYCSRAPARWRHLTPIGHAIFSNPLFTPSYHQVSLPVGNSFKIFSLFLVFTSVFLKNNLLSYCALLIKSNFCFYQYPLVSKYFLLNYLVYYYVFLCNLCFFPQGLISLITSVDAEQFVLPHFPLSFFLSFNIYLFNFFIWLHQVLVAALLIAACGI